MGVCIKASQVRELQTIGAEHQYQGKGHLEPREICVLLRIVSMRPHTDGAP